LFDRIFTQLVVTIEVSARTALAQRLMNVAFAPSAICRVLAFDDTISIAQPILENSERLDNATLAENACSKSQQHLLAISRRRHLDEVVTDVLVERGEKPVILSAARNLGARFSDAGFTTLVRRSEGDDELSGCIGLRRDIPRHHLLKLLAKASLTVRRKLEAADPLSSEAIRNAVAEATSAIQARTTVASRDYAAAQRQVESLRASGQLGERELEAFAKAGKFEETTVALAMLCDLPIKEVEPAMIQDRRETVLILARAIGISWPTVKEILKMRVEGRRIPTQELEQCLGTFSRLKPATARQVIEFQRKRALNV
jgi:uncharacterized protein (DUF2336 family)